MLLNREELTGQLFDLIESSTNDYKDTKAVHSTFRNIFAHFAVEHLQDLYVALGGYEKDLYEALGGYEEDLQ